MTTLLSYTRSFSMLQNGDHLQQILTISMHNSKKIQELYSNADSLFLQFSAYFKKLIHDKSGSNQPTKDQRKILKLFSYSTWQQYMTWVQQKLQQNGQNVENNNNMLSEIIEESEQESIGESHLKQISNRDNSESEMLAIENSKLRRQNIILEDKIDILCRIGQKKKENRRNF